jgi:GNAT superfamily N-acetyltransferase
VAVAPERVLGHATVELVTMPDRMPFVPRKYGLVRDLVVRTDSRNAGVGSALMTAAEDWSRGRGADAVELTVWSFNEDAVRLYERLGYTTQLRRLRRVVI